MLKRDFGRTNLYHLLIDFDSEKHPEVWLHVFRKELYDDPTSNEGELQKLIIVEESGFFPQTPRMLVMTREEFVREYEIDVPELFTENKGV